MIVVDLSRLRKYFLQLGELPWTFLDLVSHGVQEVACGVVVMVVLVVVRWLVCDIELLEQIELFFLAFLAFLGVFGILGILGVFGGLGEIEVF
jgi:hypothetical protein